MDTAAAAPEEHGLKSLLVHRGLGSYLSRPHFPREV